MSLILLFLACGTASITLKGDETGNLDTADADTDSDTDSDSDADSDSDSDTDTDTDSDADSDAGDYSGQVQGTITMMGGHGAPDQVLTCSGEVAFTIDDAGTLAGDATCGASDPNGPPPLAGSLMGTAVGGLAHADWTVQIGPDTSTALLLTGPVSGGTANIAGGLDFGGSDGGPTGSIDVAMTAHK